MNLVQQKFCFFSWEEVHFALSDVEQAREITRLVYIQQRNHNRRSAAEISGRLTWYNFISVNFTCFTYCYRFTRHLRDLRLVQNSKTLRMAIL